MAKTWEAVHPEVRWYVEDVARQVHRRRWFGAAKRFGWTMFGLTGLFSATLWLTNATGTAGLVLAGFYVAALVAAAIAFSVPVLRSKVSLDQVAQYIDEKHPELESRISTALDLSLHDKEGVSAWLTQQFLDESLDRVRNVSLADVLDPAPARNLGYSAAAMVVSSLIMVYLFAGSWLPALSLLIPGHEPKVAELPFTVEPGDVRVRRGDNQMIWVRTTEADREVIVRWRVPGAEWQDVAANPSSTEKVYFHEFTNVQQDMQYEVRFGRQRSKQFAITAWLPPEVTGIDLTYHYPDYLQQPTREVPNSGNIAAVEGTTVDLDVWTNKTVDKAEMVLESGERLPLARKDDTRWQVPVTVAKDDAYRIELIDEDGERNEYPARYTIAMHRDKAPEVKIEFPRGDNEVTMLEEVPFNFSVSDDYGLEDYGVQFEVAGREPVRVTLGEGGQLITAAQGSHQLPLEDLVLEVGDFITWTIWAKDTKPNRDEYEQVGDPFFLEVRPFKREFREAISGGGQQGQQGQQSEPEEKQKDILIATWNLRRDSRFMDETEFTEKRGIIVDSQTQLMKDIAQGDNPMAPPSEEILKLREVMQGSVDALNRAALPDPKAPLSDATVQQQNALRLLARMKPREAQVTQSQGGGAGGGSGQDQDLNELEMARNRNFYEQENLTREQQEATDEVLDRIKELALRQQNINEELAKLISELQTAKSEEERERLRKQLERLREEMRQNLERLDQAKQDLNENAMNNEQARNAQESLDRARHQMNRTLEQMDQNDLQQARAAGSRASEALDDIKEQLEQFGRTGAAQRMRELQQNMRELQEQQRQIVADAESAREMHQSPSMENQKKVEEMQNALGENKEKLAEDFKAMMEEASELAARAGQTQELMSRRLGDWMRETAKEGIYEDIHETKPLVEYGIWDTALAEEKRIDEKLTRAAEGLDAVAEALVGTDLEGMQKALENLDNLLQREEIARALSEQGNDPQQPGAGAQPNSEDPNQPGGGAGEPQPDQQQPGAGTQPQENQQPGAGQGEQNERMAEAQGQQGGGEQQNENSQQPGSGRGEQSEDQQNQQGSGQGEQQDQASQQQGGQSGGEQNQEGQQNQRGQQQGNQRMAGNPQRGGSSGGADNRGGSNNFGGGAWDGDWDPDAAMRDFAEDGYAEYLESLRNAESLLPPGELRDEVTRLRERVEGMRRDWRVRSLAPRFDLFLEMTARPLADVAMDVQREIERLLDEKEFLAQDEGDVPERYREPVAEYFKRLSEAEGLN